MANTTINNSCVLSIDGQDIDLQWWVTPTDLDKLRLQIIGFNAQIKEVKRQLSKTTAVGGRAYWEQTHRQLALLARAHYLSYGFLRKKNYKSLEPSSRIITQELLNKLVLVTDRYVSYHRHTLSWENIYKDLTGKWIRESNTSRFYLIHQQWLGYPPNLIIPTAYISKQFKEILFSETL